VEADESGGAGDQNRHVISSSGEKRRIVVQCGGPKVAHHWTPVPLK
jgi:hypothetical protein